MTATKRVLRKRQRLEVDARREQLLALGIRLFSEKSYDEVSIDEVAKRAGISKGLLYHYFPTKRDFYVAGVRVAAQRLLEETKPSQELDPLTNLRHGLVAYLGFAQRHGKAYVALMRGGIGSDSEVSTILDETRGAFVERALAQISANPKQGELRVAFRGWIGFVEAIAIEWLQRRSMTREALVALAESVLVGLIAQFAVNLD